MEMTNPNDPEQVLASLSDILPRVYQAIEESLVTARAHFESRDRGFYPWLTAHILRDETKTAIDKIRLTDVDLMLSDFDREDIAFSGLSIIYGKYRIKIYKGKNGVLPASGRTKANRDFFYQPSLGDYFEYLNLVIIWNVDINYNLVDMRLACPRYPEKYPENSQEHWSIPIPPPSGTIIVKPFDDPVEDLPFERKRLALTGSDAGNTDDRNEND
jgi:hypothetical protein